MQKYTIEDKIFESFDFASTFWFEAVCSLRHPENFEVTREILGYVNKNMRTFDMR